MKTQIIILLIILISVAFSCRKDPNIDLEVPTATEEEFKFDISSEWTYRDCTYVQPPPGFGNNYFLVDTTYFWFEGDTVMERNTRTNYNAVESNSNVYIYHKLKFHRKLYHDDGWQTTLSESSGLRAFIRNDTITDRLYITYEDGVTTNTWPMYLQPNEEVLLIDFNLDYNDTLDWCRWNQGYGGDYIVQEKETRIINNYKFEELKLYKNNYYQYSIFTGIGGLQRFDGTGGNLIHFHCDKFDFEP